MRRRGEHWRVVGLDASIREERRARDDVWSSAGPEPEHDGVRLWMWTRLLVDGTSPRARTGVPGWPALRAILSMGHPARALFARRMAHRLDTDREGATKRLTEIARAEPLGSVPLMLALWWAAEPHRARIEQVLAEHGDVGSPDHFARIERSAVLEAPTIASFQQTLAGAPARLRLLAAQFLHALGPFAFQAENALAAAAKDEDPQVREAASAALEAVRHNHVRIEVRPDRAHLMVTLVPRDPGADVPRARHRAMGAVHALEGAIAPGPYLLRGTSVSHVPFARARLDGITATLAVSADGRFELQIGTGDETSLERGTFTVDRNRITLHATDKDGRPLERPSDSSAGLDKDGVLFYVRRRGLGARLALRRQ